MNKTLILEKEMPIRGRAIDGLSCLNGGKHYSAQKPLGVYLEDGDYTSGDFADILSGSIFDNGDIFDNEGSYEMDTDNIQGFHSYWNQQKKNTGPGTRYYKVTKKKALDKEWGKNLQRKLTREKRIIEQNRRKRIKAICDNIINSNTEKIAA